MRGVTVREQLVEEFREKILSLELLPGAELNPLNIAQSMGISKSPVREALLQLSEENLVEIVPQSGTRVSRINLSQVEEEQFLRISLEKEAAVQFCQRATDDDIRFLENEIQYQSVAGSNMDFARFLKEDDNFHQYFFKAIKMQRMWNVIQSQNGNYQRIRLLSFEEPEIIPSILEEHRQLVEAMKTKNVDRVLDVENMHLGKLRFEIKPLTDKNPDYFTHY